MESFIEFGDFNISMILSACEGVELPSSWSHEDSFNPLLSFFAAAEGTNNYLPFDELLLTLMANNTTSKNVEKGNVGQFNAGSGDVKKNEMSNKVKQNNETVFSHVTNVSSDINSSYAIVNPVVHEADKQGSILKQPSQNIVSDSNNTAVHGRISIDPGGCDTGTTGLESYEIDQSLDLTHRNARQYVPEGSNQTSRDVMHDGQEKIVQNLCVTNEDTTKAQKSTSDETTTYNTNLRRENSVQKPVLVNPQNDPLARSFAIELSKLKLVCKPKAFIPRGLYNSSNWCYINATLQALLACPPFFHMLKKLSFFRKENRQITSTPIMDCFVRFACEFQALSFQYCQQYGKDIKPGLPFTPGYVYDMLSVIKSTLSIVGGQEDAEEFLSCILNGFHEEILHLFSLLPNGVDVYYQKSNCDNENTFHNDTNNSFPSAVDCERETPISKIFRGKMRTTVTRLGQKPSVSYEPFFTIPIDVSSEHAWSVEDALHSLTDGESCDHDSKPSVIRKQTIESLPPILILHLKRFIYNKNGGSLKVDKRVHFKTDLVIQNQWLSETAPDYNIDQRSYKLFAVVYHHGVKATGGHYSADVFHIGIVSWLRIDDQHIWPIKLVDVTSHSSKRTPYLLYYRQKLP